MKYRGANGKYLTQSLFYELTDDQRYAIFTTKPEDITKDGKTYLSARRLFVACEDPTGYKFATTYLENFEHWLELQRSNKQLRNMIQGWQEELAVKLVSLGIGAQIEEVKANGKGAMAAARYLADEGWKPKRKAGRPSKEEVQGQLKKEAEIENEFSNDLKLIQGLKR